MKDILYLIGLCGVAYYTYRKGYIEGHKDGWSEGCKCFYDNLMEHGGPRRAN